MTLDDLRQLLGHVDDARARALNKTQHPRTSLKLLNRGARELLERSELGVPFNDRAFLERILDLTAEATAPTALKEAHCTELRRLVNDAINRKAPSTPASISRPPSEPPKADAPKAEPPKAEPPKADAPKAEPPKADAPKTDAPKAEPPKADAPPASSQLALWAGIASLVAVLGVVVYCVRTPPPEPTCEPGYVLKARSCVQGERESDAYARCMMSTASKETSQETSTQVKAGLQVGDSGPSSAVEVHDKATTAYLRSKEKCVLLDISARCFTLVTNRPSPHSLPPECSSSIVPAPSSVPPTGSAPVPSTSVPRPVSSAPKPAASATSGPKPVGRPLPYNVTAAQLGTRVQEGKTGLDSHVNFPPGTKFAVVASGDVKTDNPVPNSPAPFWIELELQVTGCKNETQTMTRGKETGYKFSISVSDCTAVAGGRVKVRAIRCQDGSPGQSCVFSDDFKITFTPE